jgi:hypothetical protein
MQVCRSSEDELATHSLHIEGASGIATRFFEQKNLLPKSEI